MTYLGNHTVAVQKGLNLGVILFIVSEACFFVAIFWAFFHKALWIVAKFRGHPKALITKLFTETFKVAWLMTQGIVTSLEIIDLNQWMGNRGSKSDSFISVKEQRVDGYSISSRYCKVYSNNQRNLVFRLNNNNIILNHWPALFIRRVGSFNNFYSKTPCIALFSTKVSRLNPYYVTGFTDGEGCFFVGVSPDSKSKTDFRVKAIFQIGVHIKDIALLEEIKLFFNVGNISKLGSDSIQYRVTGINDLKVIVNHFDQFPLLTYKQSDYLLFKQVVELIEEKKHLTLEGLNCIISIKASLNSKKITDNLKSVYSLRTNIIPALIPQINVREIKDLNWLAGFTDAEGCFFIALKKSLSSKLGEAVWLKFILTQHIRDNVFLHSLISTLNCGRYVTKPGYGEFIVEKFKDIDEKILPIFETFKLHGVKSKEYEDFKKAAAIIRNKDHLTREGLDNIKKIKGQMNKNRKH